MSKWRREAALIFSAGRADGRMRFNCAGARRGGARFSAVCGQGLGAELRKKEYQKGAEFLLCKYGSFQVSSLVTRLTSDVTTIQNAVSTGMPSDPRPAMMLTAILVSFLSMQSWRWYFFVAAPLLGVILYQIIRHVRLVYGRMQSAIDSVNRIIQEGLAISPRGKILCAR